MIVLAIVVAAVLIGWWMNSGFDPNDKYRTGNYA